MMRGPAGMAVAVRLGDGHIILFRVARRLPADRHPIWRLPVLRGLAALADSLALGMQALLHSAELAAAPAGPDPSPADAPTPGMGWAVAPSVLIGLAVFVVLPALLAGRLRPLLPSASVAGLVEGLLRLLLVLGYLLAITVAPDVRRVLQYHGAEHKALAAGEAGMPLEVAAARRCTRFHPRCGTSYLLFVLLLAGFAFALLGWQALWLRVVLRLALLPALAGIGYELLRLSSRGRGRGARMVATPGLWLQRLTTREPDDSQLQVALAALEAAIRMAEDGAGRAAGPTVQRVAPSRAVAADT